MPINRTRATTASSPKPTFSADDLIAALTASAHESDDAITSEELAERVGLCVRTVVPRLRKLWKAGRIETVKVQRPCMRGYSVGVVAYRLKA
jgi:hypothetical protein